MDVVMILLDIVPILSVLALCWNLLHRIEALERGTRAMRREVDDLRIEECRRLGAEMGSRARGR